MASATIGFGIALIVLGVAGYFGTDRVSPTALIPAAFGLVLALLGAIARDPGKRKHAMHGAAMIGLLGFLGSAMGLIQTAKLLAGEEIQRPAAAISRAIMAAICLVFLILCVRSFINARREREQEGTRTTR